MAAYILGPAEEVKSSHAESAAQSNDTDASTPQAVFIQHTPEKCPAAQRSRAIALLNAYRHAREPRLTTDNEVNRIACQAGEADRLDVALPRRERVVRLA
ncbi:hypothetical protein D3C81_695490 [compost metagenome]